MKPAAIRIS